VPSVPFVCEAGSRRAAAFASGMQVGNRHLPLVWPFGTLNPPGRAGRAGVGDGLCCQLTLTASRSAFALMPSVIGNDTKWNRVVTLSS